MDIDLYIDRVYHGFYPITAIEERFEEYRLIAEEAAKDISDDEVVLYAIYAFDYKTQRFIYANFMIKKLKLEHYARVCRRLSPFCRLFCIWNG